MRNYLAFILLLMATIVTTVPSCKKMDQGITTINKQDANSFFKVPSNTPSAIKKAVAAFEKQDIKYNFFENLVKQNGYPLWSKSLIQVSKKGNSQAANFDGGGLEAGDTLVFTPLLNEDSTFINGFLLTKEIGDSSELHLYRGNDYDNYPYGPTDSSKLTAERITLQLMQLNSAVFGYTEFVTTDTFLFTADNPHSLDTNTALKKIKIKEETGGSFSSSGSSDNLIRTVHITICTLVPCTYARGTNTGEDDLRGCWMTGCTTTTVTYEEWPTGGPAPTNGGGSGGNPLPTGNCTGTNNCNQSSRIIEGRLPCGNCGPGPIDATPNPFCPNSTTVVNGDFVCPASFPGKDKGFPYLWWEDQEWIEDNFEWGFVEDNGGQQFDLSLEEIFLIMAHPVQALLIQDNALKADAKTRLYYNYSKWNDKSDAFRHCYWLAQNTRDVGVNLALSFGLAHESNVPLVLEKEKIMDIYNNNIGIMIGTGSATETELPGVCVDAVNNGILKYLSPTLTPAQDPNWNTTHGINSATQIIWTNQ